MTERKDPQPNNDDEDGVDVPTVIDIHARLIREDPTLDFISIDPVGPCGHVGRGHLRGMSREGELPLEEWFHLGGWMGYDTTAILFLCRSEDFERVSETDLNVARSMDSYARTHGELPWDLIFVTEKGHFATSDLLDLPGHPVFEPCTYDPRSEIETDTG